ncbi:MAG: SCO family protein, partial [Chloroflexota bacterium]
MTAGITQNPNETPRGLPIGRIAFGVAVVLILVTSGATFIIAKNWIQAAYPPVSIIESDGGVSTLIPPRPLADFTLTDHTGASVSLSDFAGKPVLLSFGYTYCPDVCPMTIQSHSRVHDMLGEAGDDAAYVFISVDGDRDTPERLDLFLQARGVRDIFTALTGDPGEVRRIGADYGLFFEYVDEDSGFYMVDHTASTYLIDGNGALAHIIGFNTPL